MGIGWPAQRLSAGERTPSYPARPTNLEETLKALHAGERAVLASAIAFGLGLTVAQSALADDVTVDDSGAGPVQVAAADPSDAKARRSRLGSHPLRVPGPEAEAVRLRPYRPVLQPDA